MKRFLQKLGKGVVFFFKRPELGLMTWTPLITSDSFTGITTDITTGATGIITIALMICGVGFLIAVFLRR